MLKILIYNKANSSVNDYLFFLIIALVIALAVFLIVIKVKKSLKNFSNNVFNTDSIAEGIKEQKKYLSETPKSIKAMTRVLLPLINKDFPDFNFDQFKSKNNILIRTYLNALTTQNLAGFDTQTEEIRNQAKKEIEMLKANNVRDCISDIVIHNTEICNYIKQNGICTVKFESAVGYMRYKINEKGTVISGDDVMKTQTTFTTTLSYVQDESKAENLKGLGLNCPNCGAPIKNLGQKFCDYCGTGVKEININLWKFISIKE